MKVYFQKILAFVLMMLTVFVLFVPYTAMAAEGTDTYMIENLDTSNVEDDLKVMKIKDENGQFTKTFNPEDYPIDTRNTQDRIELIAFYEKGYTKDEGISKDYGVYLYIYNPTGKGIKAYDNAVNMVQELDENGNYKSFESVKIELLSASSDYRFLKFKLMPREDQVPFVTVERSGVAYRGYAIAATYLNTGSDGVKSYSNDFVYLYSGYAEDNTLSVKGRQQDVVKLNLKQTWYRLNSSPLGQGHYSTMNAVYFSIPKSIMTKGTTLVGAEMEWYEYKTNPVLYLTNANACDMVSASNGYMGYKYARFQEEEFLDASYCDYQVGYLSKQSKENDWDAFFAKYGFSPYASGAFFVPKAGSDGMLQLVDGYGETVTGERILDQIQAWSRKYIGYEDPDIWVYASAYFQDVVDEGRVRGYNHVKLNKSNAEVLEPWKSNFLWALGTWFEYGLFTPDFDEGVSYSQIEEITALADKDISSKEIGINEYDLPTVIEDCEYAKARDERTFMLRFATTDYFYAKAFEENLEGSVYASVQTVFLNLNVLSLTVKKDGQQVVIPVSSDPIDVMADPTTSEKENMFFGIFDFTVPFSLWDAFVNIFSVLGQIAVWAVVILVVFLVYKLIRKWLDGRDRREEKRRQKERDQEHVEDLEWKRKERKEKDADNGWKWQKRAEDDFDRDERRREHYEDRKEAKRDRKERRREHKVDRYWKWLDRNDRETERQMRDIERDQRMKESEERIKASKQKRKESRERLKKQKNNDKKK